MVLDVVPEKILKNPDLSQVERQLNDYAVRLALLGEIDAARELINVLLSTGVAAKPNVVERGLRWAWKESGQWPSGCPSEWKSDESFAELRQSYETSSWGSVAEDRQTIDENGLAACLEDSSENPQFSDATTGWPATLKGERLVKALDISVRLATNATSTETKAQKLSPNAADDQTGHPAPTQLDKTEWPVVSGLDPRSASILSKIAARWNANQQHVCLARAERLWPYCLSGEVAKALGLRREDVKKQGLQLVTLFSQRLQSGYAPSVLAGKSIDELLDIANENTLRGAGTEFWMECFGDEFEAERPKTLLREPASSSDIAALEEKLGVALPDDYKAFLQISDGFGSGDSFHNGVYNGYFPDPEIYRTTDVRWDSNEHFRLPAELLDLPYDIANRLGNVQTKTVGTLEWKTALPLYDRVLVIGTRDIDNLWLIHPDLVRQAREAYYGMYADANEAQVKTIDRAIEAFAGGKEEFDRLGWCCVKWSAGGAACHVAYASFARYLEIVTANSMSSKLYA